MRTTCRIISALLLAAALAMGAMTALAADPAPATPADPAAPAAKPAAPAVCEKAKAILAVPSMPGKIKSAIEKSLKDEKRPRPPRRSLTRPSPPASWVSPAPPTPA